MARDGREVWSKRVERWRESGLTAKEYAAEVGINANTLTHWGWRLRGGGEQAGRRQRVRRAARPPQAEWIEVTVPGASVPAVGTDKTTAGPIATPLESGAAGWFELIVGQGRVIRVPSNFDPQALGRLLALVEAR